MMKHKLACFCMGLMMMITCCYAQDKYSKVRVAAPTESVKKLITDHLPLDHYISENKSIVAELSTKDLSILKKLGISYQVIIDDVAKHFTEESKKFFSEAKKGQRKQEQNARMAFEESGKSITNIIATPSLFTTTNTPPGSMGGYYTYAEMNTKMDELVAAYPGLVQKTSIGTSIEGRTLWCLKISDVVVTDENEPEVLYMGLQHAREAITGTSLIFFAQYLLQNYATDERVKQLIDNRELFIIPCVNPDGYVYNQTTNPSGGGLHRKNRRVIAGRGQNVDYGVDLNRNYSVDWSDCTGASTSCGSSDPSQDTYWGTSAFSEPETKAVRDFCYARNFVIALDQHCYGPYYSLPFGRRAYHTMPALDQKFYTYIPALMGKYNGHRAGDSKATVAYEVAGGVKDWWLLGDIKTYANEPNKKGKIYGMTGEAGGGGFWAPSSQIIELCKNLCFQNLQLAYAAGTLVDVQDRSDIAVSATSGEFDFSLRRVGLGNEPVTVSLLPLENIQTQGASVTINSFPNYYDSVQRKISYTLKSGIITGQRIRFAWKIEAGGITVYDTVTKFYNPVVLLSENMDGSLSNWSVASNVAGTSNTWGITTTSAYSGTGSLTESPGGNYTTNTVRTITYNNTFNLTNATAAFLSFWVRHRAENTRDKLQIQASANGTNWTPLHGINTIAETNTTNGGSLGGSPALTGIREEWTRELVDLSSFKGLGTVYLRFSFTSDGDASNFENELDDGFYIDEMKLVMSSANMMTTLPIGLLNVQAKLAVDRTVDLWWQANVDAKHAYFEIERSLDGQQFVSLGNTNERPYQFKDKKPANGLNYYRIKQVDKAGKGQYSKVMVIDLHEESAYAIYPNPVQDLLIIKATARELKAVTIKITDLQGREIYHNKIFEAAYINTAQWKPQVYIVTIASENGEKKSVQQIVKL